MTGRRWTITVPAPCDWITANDKRHWTDKAGLVKQWRDATYLQAKKAKLPTGLTKVRIDVVVQFAGRPPVRDLINIAPTLKAAADGLGPAHVGTTRSTGAYAAAGYGLIPDDDLTHLDGPHWTIGDPMPAKAYGPKGQLVLTIRELS